MNKQNLPQNSGDSSTSDLPDYDLEYLEELEMEEAEAEEASQRQALPQSFRGHPTTDLLKTWQRWEKRWENKEALEVPEAKLSAMYGLVKAYRLDPVSWGWDKEGEEFTETQGKSDLERAKKLLEPLGFSPQEMEAAWAKELEDRQTAST